MLRVPKLVSFHARFPRIERAAQSRAWAQRPWSLERLPAQEISCIQRGRIFLNTLTKDGKGRVAALEILKSTLRTREYIEKGDQELKTLLDAMRDGDTEGMQHFDGSIEQLIRAGTIELETGLAYATNPGNLRLQLADIAGEPTAEEPKPVPPQKSEREPELVIE